MRFAQPRIPGRAAAMTLALVVVSLLTMAPPASAAAVTSFTPACGGPGTLVTITGTGFTGMTGVDFDAGAGADPATTWTFVNDTTATAVVPVITDDGPIRVNTPVGDSPSAATFVVIDAAVPTITSFLPTSGGVGTSVVITGTNFGCATSVMFDTTPASFVVNGAKKITATVPAGATTGALHVTTTGGGPADSAGAFTVIQPPSISSFVPTSGPVGTSVVITGTNLTGATSVTVNGTAAPFTVDSPTQITATVPSTTTGPIQVTTPGGTANGATNFTVTVPAGGGGGGGGVPAPPSGVTSFSPTSGPVGTSVVITGTNLTAATSVTFGGIAATFTVDSPTQITAIVPAGASTGRIAVVITGAGTMTSSTDFTVSAAKHDRSVTLSLTGHLIASGRIVADDGFDACRSYATVRIQRLNDGAWKTVAKDQTTPNGRYRATLRDRAGKYRAVANKGSVNDGADICTKETSATVRYRG